MRARSSGKSRRAQPSTSKGVSSAPAPRALRVPTVQDLPGPAKDVVKHRARELPCLCVLLAGVVRGDQNLPARQDPLSAMPELRFGIWKRPLVLLPGFEEGLESDLTQRNHHPFRCQQLQFPVQVGPAVVHLLGEWFVLRRSAAQCRRDQAVIQKETIVPVGGRWLVRESKAVQRAVEPVSAAVAGEHPAGSVPSMGRGRKAYKDEAGIRCAECRQWTSPVFLVAVSAHFLPRHPFAPLHQPRTFPAFDDGFLQAPKLDIPGVQVPAPRFSIPWRQRQPQVYDRGNVT